ncbi:hypothetical protein SEVIR_3G150800v4 [Setaria viridis]|uniref:Uncharacterized protein n=1 Tax=Setaria viridis TaxID=4556 RepID=A0A4U6VF53_SETVI|nr:hypothetical protein SEVIR_3G150800v2 [Setaria viridis]
MKPAKTALGRTHRFFSPCFPRRLIRCARVSIPPPCPPRLLAPPKHDVLPRARALQLFAEHPNPLGTKAPNPPLNPYILPLQIFPHSLTEQESSKSLCSLARGNPSLICHLQGRTTPQAVRKEESGGIKETSIKSNRVAGESAALDPVSAGAARANCAPDAGAPVSGGVWIHPH